MSIHEWLDEADDSLDEELDGAKSRAQGRASIQNMFLRKKIGDIENAIIVWLITKKHGEIFRHRLHLPNGKFTVRTCAASKEEQDNAIQICPYHAYVATGGGAGQYGAPRVDHEYYFICLIGRLTKVLVKDKATKKTTQEDYVKWMHEPQCLGATPPIARGLTKWHKNVEYPPGAKGDITKYAFKVYGIPGDTKADVRYVVEHYEGVKEQPTHAFDPETNKEVEIDMEIARKIYDQIKVECEPNKPEMLQAILDKAMAQEAPIQDGSPDQEQSQPDTESEQAAGSTSTKLSEAHDFEQEDDGPAPTTAGTDENF